MSRDWESTFQSWGQPPSQTEQDKCENAERAIRKAIGNSASLSSRTIEVFAQGSYANRTNVRQNSDVDICVLCKDVCFTDLMNGLTDADCGLSSHPYTYGSFKNEVGQALIDHFGNAAITRGNKAFDVHANTYRIDADVVPCFEHVRYFRASNGSLGTHRGTELRPDNGGRVINWPRQNYANGVSKNDATGRSFKAAVRILKRLRNEMDDAGIGAAKPIPSFLIECLAWNVPDEAFRYKTYKADVRHVLAHLWNNTRSVDSCDKWGEINELKYLFRSAQPWTREQANSFLQAAWTYIGFE